jgi:hypothetical protein
MQLEEGVTYGTWQFLGQAIGRLLAFSMETRTARRPVGASAVQRNRLQMRVRPAKRLHTVVKPDNGKGVK